MNKNCIVCGKQFHVFPYRMKANPQYCSSGCYGRGKRGHKPWNKGLTKKEAPQLSNSGVKKGSVPWNKKPRELKICLNCSVGFYPKTLNTPNKYCCRKCANEGKVGVSLPTKGKKKPSMRGENHPNWKGEDVSYSGLHKWVTSRLGKPDTCEHCEANDLSGNDIQWCNKSGKYKRDVNDWLRLCVKCHRKYDAQGT